MSPSREVPSGVGTGVWGRLEAWSKHAEVPLLLSLVSTVQQNESAISIYAYPLPFGLVPMQVPTEH